MPAKVKKGRLAVEPMTAQRAVRVIKKCPNGAHCAACAAVMFAFARQRNILPSAPSSKSKKGK